MQSLEFRPSKILMQGLKRELFQSISFLEKQNFEWWLWWNKIKPVVEGESRFRLSRSFKFICSFWIFGAISTLLQGSKQKTFLSKSPTQKQSVQFWPDGGQHASSYWEVNFFELRWFEIFDSFIQLFGVGGIHYSEKKPRNFNPKLRCKKYNFQWHLDGRTWASSYGDKNVDFFSWMDGIYTFCKNHIICTLNQEANPIIFQSRHLLIFKAVYWGVWGQKRARTVENIDYFECPDNSVLISLNRISD